MADPSSNPTVLDYASPRQPAPREPRKPLTRSERWRIGLLAGCGGFCLALYAILQDEIHEGLRQFSILRSGLLDAKPLFLGAGFVLLLTGGVKLLQCRRIPEGILVLLGTIAASILALAIGFRLAKCTVYSPMTAADGNRYCFVGTHLPKKYEIALARIRASGLVYQTVEILDTAYLGRSKALLVIRPASRNDERGVIYPVGTGQLACCRDNECYMVYDLASHQLESDLQLRSPFLLLDDKSGIDAGDEAAILRVISSTNNYNLIPPTSELLNQALAHPNPAVRQSAAAMLKAMKPIAPGTLPAGPQ